MLTTVCPFLTFVLRKKLSKMENIQSTKISKHGMLNHEVTDSRSMIHSVFGSKRECVTQSIAMNIKRTNTISYCTHNKWFGVWRT